jgi:hypothetical protein
MRTGRMRLLDFKLLWAAGRHTGQASRHYSFLGLVQNLWDTRRPIRKLVLPFSPWPRPRLQPISDWVVGVLDDVEKQGSRLGSSEVAAPRTL